MDPLFKTLYEKIIISHNGDELGKTYVGRCVLLSFVVIENRNLKSNESHHEKQNGNYFYCPAVSFG